MQAKLLENVISLTAKMIERSKSGDYTSLADMQKIRAKLLSKVLPLPTDCDPAVYVSLLEVITEQNQQLCDYCDTARQQVKNELNGMNKNKKAVAAYKAV